MSKYKTDAKDSDGASSIKETAVIHLEQHAHDLGLETTITSDNQNIFVWDEDGRTTSRVHIVADGNERDVTPDQGDVVAEVSSDGHGITSWSFIAPNREMTSMAELAHYLVESAGKTSVTKLPE